MLYNYTRGRFLENRRESDKVRKRQSFLVSRLTVCEPGELLGIAEDELQLETCPVDVEDVTC